MDRDTNSAQSNNNDALRQELEKARINAEKRITVGMMLQQQGAEICDWVDLALRWSSIAPTGWNGQSALDSAKRLNIQLEQEYSGLNKIAYSGGTVYYSAAAVSGTMLPVMGYIHDLSPQQQEFAYEIQTDFYNLVQRSQYREKTLTLFHTLGFNATPKGQVAIYQFDSAWEVHLQKPKSPTSSLIPLREAIDVSIGELVRLKPRQEDSKRDKIIKLLSQVSAAYIQPLDMQRLQDRYAEIHDKLSGVKDKVIDRDEENALMIDATLFLTELLSAIDLAKLRK